MSARPRQLGLIGHQTPLEPALRLSAELGGPTLYVKRDDATTVGLGGNKVRKLDFLVADAIAQRADTLLTIGGLQSNHCRQTAAVAARQGLHCQVLLVESGIPHAENYARTGNVLLSRLFGAEIVVIGEPEDRAATLAQAAEALRQRGRKPYVMPAGGSTAVGCLGYAQAAHELLAQCSERGLAPKAIVHTSGSGGTQAGLVAGLAHAGSTIPVIGISCGKRAGALASIVAGLAQEVGALLSLPADALADPIVLDDYVGPGYAIPDARTIDAIRLCASTEGLMLDPVYTGKSMAGLIDLVAQGRFTAADSIVYLHTGGSPAIYAYEDALA